MPQPELSAKVSRNIADQVAEQVRQWIASGELQPGEHLKQDRLISVFGVSSTVVREAVRRLESEGFVYHQHQQGAFVMDVSNSELLEVVVPVRLALERAAWKWAMASSGWEALLEDLKSKVAAMRAAAERGDVEGINDVDMMFHDAVVSCADSPRLSQLWSSITPRLRVQFSQLAPYHADLSQAVREHEELLDAAQTRDLDRLDPVLVRHVVSSTEELLARSSRGDEEDGGDDSVA